MEIQYKPVPDVENPLLMPAFSSRNIPIAMLSSDYFTPYAATTMQSIIVHSSADYNYDFIVITSDMSEQNRLILRQMSAGLQNISIRFYNAEPIFCDIRDQLTVESRLNLITFYRVALPYIMKNYDKAICIDSDLVFETDISALFEVEIGEDYFAAVRDIFIQGFVRGAFPEFMEYCANEYELKNIDDYVNTGVLIFNLLALRKQYSLLDILRISTKQKYFFQEQDVINLLAEGHLFLLDERWNLTAYDNPAAPCTLEYVPAEYCQKYLLARHAPYVIHYAGGTKPWSVADIDYAHRFWFYARQTPFYEVILYRLMQGLLPVHYQSSAPYQSRARKLADKLLPKGSRRRNLAKKILPKGSRRWNFCKKIYYKIFKR